MGVAGSPLFGVPCDKKKDKISVTFLSRETASTKGGVLQHLAVIYDRLGLVSPVLLRVKILYRDICDQKLSWDQEIPESTHRRWVSWKRRLPEKIEVPRSLPSLSLPIQTIQLHAFADASKDGTAVALYAVVSQGKIVERGLLLSKSRLSRKQLSIPRQDLVAAHMAPNLSEKVKWSLGQIAH